METNEKKDSSLAGVYALLAVNLVLVVIFGVVLSYGIVSKSPKIDSIEKSIAYIGENLDELSETTSETADMVKSLEAKIEDSTKKSVEESSSAEEEVPSVVYKTFSNDDFPFIFNYENKYSNDST